MPRLQAVPDQPRRMIVYVRQSVERDGSISPEVQERACRDYIAQRGDEVAAVIADVGVSGLKWDRRPGIQRAMAMIPGEADGIVVWRWSRLSRKRLHQAVALDAVERAGGVVESATEPFDTATAGGRFGREVMLAAAAFESQQKAEQWADAHRRRVERGLPASGGRRFGYRLEGGVYVVDAETGPILAECYRRYLAGQGMQQIADWLNALGLPSPRAGVNRWSKRGVTYMLDAGFGAGMLHQYRAGTHVRGAHEPVIAETVWRAYLLERERRRTVAPRTLHPAWGLAGIVHCGHCGYAMTLKSHSGPRSHLRCSHRECEGRPLLPRSNVEDEVLTWLPTVAPEVERLSRSRPRAVVRTERARLARAVADADRALRTLLVDKARTRVPPAIFDAALAELTQECARAQRMLDEADREHVSLDGAARMAGSLSEMWAAAEPEDINVVARNLLRVKVFRLSWGTNHTPARHRVDVQGVWEST